MIEFLGKNRIFCEKYLHQIKEEDTIEGLAKFYKTTVFQIKQQNKNDFKTGRCIIIENANKNYHIVQPCETFDSIAKLYNLTSQYLKEKNRVNTLFIGMRLEI